MKKFLQKKLKDQKGMTLIELLAVIVIIAIIAAIAIPAISNLIQNSREDALVADAQNVLSAAALYFAENEGADTVEDGGLGNYLETQGKITDFTVTNGTTLTITFTGDAGNKKYTVEDATKEELNKGRDIFSTENDENEDDSAS